MTRVQLLLRTADDIARKSKVDPMLHAQGFAEAWRLANPASFRQLAVIAGMKPDPILHGLFLGELDKRAK